MTPFLISAVFTVLISALLFASPSFASSSTVNLKFTARYFLPAQCAPSYNDLNRVWNYTMMANSPSYTPSAVYPLTGYSGGAVSNQCPIWNDIASGTYAGHPDFEVFNGNDPYSVGCSGLTYDITNSTFCTNACYTCDVFAALTKVVESNVMQTGEDGIPKPTYCKRNTPLDGRRNTPTSVPSSDDRCGWNVGSPTPRATTSGSDSFSSWFNDNPKYNRRIGFRITLTPTVTPSVVSYNSTSETTKRFHPCGQNTNGRCKPCAVVNGRISCANGGFIWPPHIKRSWDEIANPTSVFSFTTEHHSFFTFRGTEILEFTGDDDVWIYINERLAVDLGGLHPESTVKINLSHAYVQARLGLVVGQVYSFDTFHAERRTNGANFKLSSSLTPECNVMESGKLAYTWTPTTLMTDWKLVGGPTWGIKSGTRLILTDQASSGTVSYAYLRQQVNVGQGFIAQFTFQASSNGEGFVFGMRRDDITNMNGGSGGNLGFKNTFDSFGVAFDFCSDRDTNATNPPCLQSEVRLHYLDEGGMNNATNATKKLKSKFYAPYALNDNVTHTVLVRYFAQRPPWLEVYIDDDLFLQKRGINLDTVLLGKSAYVGFTASTGSTASTILLNDFFIKTVLVEDKFTKAVGWPSNTTTTAIANGRQRAKFVIQNYDFCNGTIEFGGSSSRVAGVLYMNTTATAPVSGRRLINATEISAYVAINATVVDLENGQYSLEFASLYPGNYSLKVWYGAGCFASPGVLLTNPPTSTCFMQQALNVATFAPVVPPPTVSDESSGLLPAAALTGLGVAAGIVSFCGMIMIVVGIRVRNQWRRDKIFIDAGRIAAAEKGVSYMGDSELDKLQNQLQSTLHSIQSERARRTGVDDKQNVIDEMLRQQGELQEQVRRLKIRAIGGDENAPIAELSAMARVRKSFKPLRPMSMSFAGGASMSGDNRTISNRISMAWSKRFPQGVVGKDPKMFNKIEQETIATSGNPLFQDISNRISTKADTKGPPPAPSQNTKPAQKSKKLMPFEF